MVAVCPACGHEFRDVKVSSTVQQLVDKLEHCREESARAEAIIRFVVPNTKEDLLEFAILASTTLQSIADSQMLLGDLGDEGNAWKTKAGQVEAKAAIVCAGDKVVQEQIQSALNRVKAVQKKVARGWWIYGLIISLGVIGMVGLAFWERSIKDTIPIIWKWVLTIFTFPMSLALWL
jgi:hypothetical protein